MLNLMGKARAFIAIEIPEDIKLQLKQVQERLKQGLTGVNWARPEGIHLTLKFLGNIDEEMISRIGDSMKKATERSSVFSIRLSGLGIFPGPRFPRVVWIGVKEGGEDLKGLNRAIDKTMDKLGFSAEEREFRPHLTLGRVRSQERRDELLKAIEELQNFETGSFEAREVSLIKSDLKPGGAVYTKLLTVPLGIA